MKHKGMTGSSMFSLGVYSSWAAGMNYLSIELPYETNLGFDNKWLAQYSDVSIIVASSGIGAGAVDEPLVFTDLRFEPGTVSYPVHNFADITLGSKDTMGSFNLVFPFNTTLWDLLLTYPLLRMNTNLPLMDLVCFCVGTPKNEPQVNGPTQKHWKTWAEATTREDS